MLELQLLQRKMLPMECTFCASGECRYGIRCLRSERCRSARPWAKLAGQERGTGGNCSWLIHGGTDKRGAVGLEVVQKREPVHGRGQAVLSGDGE